MELKERMEEKVAESVVEGLINKAVDGEGKVDLDGDKVSIKEKMGKNLVFEQPNGLKAVPPSRFHN